ncbi:MAG: CHASE2 domain-containing protein [Cyanobacteria bacterium P01_C01_bin.69]
MTTVNEYIQTACGRFQVVAILRENPGAVQTLTVAKAESPETQRTTSKHFILKRLTGKNAVGLASLRREARHLQAITHRRIPQLIQAQLEDESKACLIMERIGGTVLLDWIEEGNSPTPKQLHRWLVQSCKLLASIHEQGLIHQDISPNNIILRDRKIHFIDFGGSLGTRPYAAPELLLDADDEDNIAGAHTPQTDFYALGRTFQHLLFGNRWKEARNSERKALRNELGDEFSELAKVIYWMAESAPGDRPISADQILERLHAIKPKWQKIKEKRRWLPGVIAITACTLTLGLRQANLLQRWELIAYDNLIQLSSWLAPEPQDDRLVVISIDKNDHSFQANHADPAMAPQGDDSISDAALSQLMTTLLKDADTPPAVIGLDIRRDKAISPSYPQLVNFIKNSADYPLLLVCHVAGTSDDSSEPFAQPTDVSQNSESVVFSDLPANQEGIDAGVIRRVALSFESDSALCPAFNALSFAASTRYLRQQGFQDSWGDGTYDFESTVPTEETQLSEIPFLPNKLHVGGYRLSEEHGSGYQLFINYRRRQQGPTDLAPHFSLTQVLKGDFPPGTFDGKVVLIGVDRKSTAHIGDRHPVPQGGRVAGVFVHAHIISQIISYVEDGRPLIWALPQATGDRIFVLIVSLGAGVGMAGLLARRKGTVGAIAYTIGGAVILYVISLSAFITTALWLPLVPAVLGWTLSGTAVFAHQKYQEEHPYAY